jgi:hypothetical protein
MKNSCKSRFLRRPCRIKGKWAISSFQNFLILFNFWLWDGYLDRGYCQFHCPLQAHLNNSHNYFSPDGSQSVIYISCFLTSGDKKKAPVDLFEIIAEFIQWYPIFAEITLHLK